MKTRVNLRVGLEYHEKLKQISIDSGIPIITLTELAIKRLSKINLSDLKKLSDDYQASYEKALERLSNDDYDKAITKTLKTGGVKDPTDPLDIMIKDKPIGKPKQEIKLTMPDKAATRIDEALSNSNGLAPELDIDDLLSTEE